MEDTLSRSGLSSARKTDMYVESSRFPLSGTNKTLSFLQAHLIGFDDVIRGSMGRFGQARYQCNERSGTMHQSRWNRWGSLENLLQVDFFRYTPRPKTARELYINNLNRASIGLSMEAICLVIQSGRQYKHSVGYAFLRSRAPRPEIEMPKERQDSDICCGPAQQCTCAQYIKSSKKWFLTWKDSEKYVVWTSIEGSC